MKAGNPRNYKQYVPVSGVSGATHLMLTVSFRKGGMNYATYKTEPGGYWASVTPVTVEKSKAGFETVAYALFDKRGFTVFLLPGDRFSNKTLQGLAKAVFAEGAGVAAAFDRDDRETAARLLRLGAAA